MMFSNKMTTLLLCTLISVPAFAQQPVQQSDRNFAIAKNLDIFNSIYKNLELFYVDTLETEKIVRTGIEAILDQMDPYTEYFPYEEEGDLKMMTTGKYGGMGSLIRQRKDSTVIIAEPYEGMPAAEAGLQVGDVLLRIDDVDLKGKNTSQVSELLRGEAGTTFLLTVQRPGEKNPRQVKITRSIIKLPAIEYTGMVDKSGYIDLTQFTEDCSVDVRKAIINLKSQGATSIILDLRSNGGGLLDEAVNIVNLFVPQDTLVVETRGKLQSLNTVFKTTGKPLDLDIPVVVLVSGNSASAAEIVAGALQDYHRATIVGSQTYGKGLVQTPREVPYNGNLKLTTAKYYLPSGRCIQKIDYKARREGKKAVSEGGITPDVTVHHDTIQNMVVYLANDDVLIDYGTLYCQTHTRPASVADFHLTDADVAEFLDMVKKSGFTYDRLSEKRLSALKEMMEFEGYYEDAKPEFQALEKKLHHDIDVDFRKYDTDIRRLMANEIVKRWFFQSGAIEESLKDDDDLRHALEALK